MQRLAIGGGVTIGIVTYSGWGGELHNEPRTTFLDQGKPQEARDLLAPVYSWFAADSARAI